MRYICFKKILSKIADEDIRDADSIKTIFTTIERHDLTFSIRAKGGVRFDKARILSLNEDTLSYLVFTSSSKLKKESRYEDIEEIELVLVDDILAYFKPRASRWSLLDADDLDS